MPFDLPVFIACTLLLVLTIYFSRNKSKNVDDKLQMIKENLIKIDPRANKVEFYTDSNEAYTLGKKEIYICVKDSKGEYYNNNTLMYVALHELAHVLIPEDTSKHPPKFDNLFNQLKERAAYMGLYNPSIPFPSEYCGKKLSYY